MEKTSRDFWSAAVCFNFVDSLLNHVKATLVGNDPGKLYMMEYRPGQGSVVLKKLVRKTDLEDYKIIPDWFVEQWDNSSE